MGEQTREKETETWSDFIREFLNEGGVIYGSRVGSLAAAACHGLRLPL